MQYVLEPPDLTKLCDGCNPTLSILYALDQKNGELVTERHNNLYDRVIDLTGKSFTPTHVRNGLLIYAGCAVKYSKDNLEGYKHSPPSHILYEIEQKGYILIYDIRKKGNDIVHDMRAMNTDAKSYVNKTQVRCINDASKAKKYLPGGVPAVTTTLPPP